MGNPVEIYEYVPQLISQTDRLLSQPVKKNNRIIEDELIFKMSKLISFRADDPNLVHLKAISKWAARLFYRLQ